MDQLHASYKHIFKEINPAKKYAEFTFTDFESFKSASSDAFILGYCSRGEIVRINGIFYQFARTIEEYTRTPNPSVIQFRKDGRLVYESEI